MIVALDYIFSCFLLILHSNCFWLDNSSDIDVYIRTYLLYNACTDHHCSTGMHLGGHLFTCTYYVVVVTLEIGSACTMSCAISRKYIQQHATSWNGIFCENNNKIGTSTQFVNKPIHYLFTAFNVISIAFFLHTLRSNL